MSVVVEEQNLRVEFNSGMIEEETNTDEGEIFLVLLLLLKDLIADVAIGIVAVVEEDVVEETEFVDVPTTTATTGVVVATTGVKRTKRPKVSICFKILKFRDFLFFSRKKNKTKNTLLKFCFWKIG